VPAEVFYAACRRLGLDTRGSMPELGERVARAGGIGWDASCDSRATPSGGGSTVTLEGLNRMLDVLERRTQPDPVARAEHGLGVAYRVAAGGVDHEVVSILVRDLSSLDAATRVHAATQNAVADLVTSRGLRPLSPDRGEVAFDVAWRCQRGVVVCEVKGVTGTNRRQQVRLGLGQVLDYRSATSGKEPGNVQAVIVISESPAEHEVAFCAAVDVVVTAPERLAVDLAPWLR
jgi:hypothetical protein